MSGFGPSPAAQRELIAHVQVRRRWAPWQRWLVVSERIDEDDDGQRFGYYRVMAVRRGRRVRAAWPPTRDRSWMAYQQMVSWARSGRWPGLAQPVAGTACRCGHGVAAHDRPVDGFEWACRDCVCGQWHRRLLTTSGVDEIKVAMVGRAPWRWQARRSTVGLWGDPNPQRWTGRAWTRAGLVWAWWWLRWRLARVEGVTVWADYGEART